jgi:hypothetical protein
MPKAMRSLHMNSKSRACLQGWSEHLLLSLHLSALAKLGTTPELVLAWLGRQGYHSRELACDHEIHSLTETL